MTAVGRRQMAFGGSIAWAALVALLMLVGPLAAGEAPAWFSERSVDPAVLSGHGTGATVEAARLAALADLADQVAVSVASSRASTLSTTSDDGATAVHEDFRQVLRSSSAFRDLGGAEIAKREQLGASWFVAVAIARDRLRQQLTARLAELDTRLSRGLGERPAKPTAAWAAGLRDLLAAAREREALAAAAIGQGDTPAASPLPASAVRLHCSSPSSRANVRPGWPPACAPPPLISGLVSPTSRPSPAGSCG
jgi:hypothetical protein